MKHSKTSIIFLSAVLFSCSTVPLTGRKQFAPLPESQMASMGVQNYQQIVKQEGLSDNQQQAQMIQEVGQEISSAVSDFLRDKGEDDMLEAMKWEYHLLESEQVNAFALPGGKIAFYDGIMPIAKTRAGIATIMGHEVAHVIAQHSNERMSQMLATQLGGIALAVALREQPEKTQRLALAAFGLGAQVGLILPYSRLQEREADRLGLVFMAMAGYDPREAPDLWKRMKAQQEGPKPPTLLSTHPHPEERIDNLQEQMPEAMEYYRQTQSAVVTD